MARVPTPEEYEARFKDQPITFIGKYRSSRHTILVRCNICGREFLFYPSRIRTGGKIRCFGCEPSKAGSHIQNTPIEVVRENLAAIPNIELVGEYVGMASHALFRCTKCEHEWRTKPTAIITCGTRCPKCRKNEVINATKANA